MIEYDLAESADVRLTLYDVAGQAVMTLVRGAQGAGRYRATWDGTDRQGAAVASGVYLLELRAGAVRRVQRMALIR